MVRFEKTEGGYSISDGERSLFVPDEKFPDLYFSVPIAPTYFFRLLTDDILQTDEDRHTLREMLDAAGLTAALDSIMEEIQQMDEPA